MLGLQQTVTHSSACNRSEINYSGDGAGRGAGGRGLKRTALALDYVVVHNIQDIRCDALEGLLTQQRMASEAYK